MNEEIAIKMDKMYSDCLHIFPSEQSTFMNYGLMLRGSKAQNANPHLNLLTELFRGYSMEGQKVLDVGCGRGGAASFIFEALGAASVVGIDINKSIILQNRKFNRERGIRYLVGNAQQMRFKENSFDSVVNIESSHCYPDRSHFFKEAYRVCRSGGRFFYTDLFATGDPSKVEDELLRSGFFIDRAEDISSGVLLSIRQMRMHWKKAVVLKTPYTDSILFLLSLIDRAKAELENGSCEYRIWVLTKI